MRTRRTPWWYLIGLAAVMVTGVACSDDPESMTGCGEGTVLEGGECVPEDRDECDEDEVLTPEGECEDPDQFACDDGTTYDRGLGECVSETEIGCGEGTVEVDGECVLDDPLVCGEGTVLYDGECVVTDEVCGDGTSFDDENIDCQVDPSACGPGAEYDLADGECVDHNLVESCGDGTREIDGRCVSNETYADELAGQADVSHGDDSAIVASTADKVVFEGTLDDELSHQFDVDGLEGQWLEITLYSRGVPSPGLSLEKGDSADWSREVEAGTATTPERTVLLPADGDYELTVETAMAEDPDWGDEGKADWKYVGTVQQLETPEPTWWAAFDEVHEGDLDATTDNFLEIDVEEVYEVILTVDSVGEDARETTVELWTEPDEYLERHSVEGGDDLELETADLSTLYLHVDAVGLQGAELDYELYANTTEVLQPGDFYDEQIDVEAGDVVFLSHESDEAEPVAAEVRFDGQREHLFSNMLAVNQSSYDEDETKRQFFYARQSGTYTVRFHNNSLTTITSFVGMVRTQEVPVFEVADDGQPQDFDDQVDAQDLEPGDWRFVVVDTPGPSMFEATIEAETGSPRASVYTDVERDRIADASETGETTDVDFDVAEGGIYYLVARPHSTFTEVSDLSFEVTGRTVDVLEAGQEYTETFDADAFDLLWLDVTWGMGDDAEIRLYNEVGNLIWEETTTEPVDDLLLMPGTGQYTLTVENTGQEPMLGVDADFELRPTFASVVVDNDYTASWIRDPLSENERDDMVVSADQMAQVFVDVEFGADDQARLELWDVDAGELIDEIEGTEHVGTDLRLEGDRTYGFGIEALSDFDDEYDLSIETFEVTDVSVSSTPDAEISDGWEAEDTVNVEECESIHDIEVFVDISHSYIGDIAVDIIGPDGSEARIHDYSGGYSSDIYATYPDPDDPWNNLDDGHELYGFIGDDGSGEWTIYVQDDDEWDNFSWLNEWSLSLVCLS